MNKKVQILRALAVIAVIIIHTCPSGIYGVAIRPFVNFSVAMFIFLSGYLTNLHIDNKLEFYKKRISRVLIPYLIWSVLYTIVFGDYSKFLYNIFTTRAAGPFYYIAVYIQLVLITPFLKKIIKIIKFTISSS